MFFFSLMCLRLHLFYFIHISVDFRVPLADALGQIRSILDRFGCNVWSNFPALSAARAELLQKLRKNLAEN